MADFDISNYVGADDTETVNNALLAAAAAGGGRVMGFNPQVPLNIDTNIPTGGIRMQSNTHLDLGMAGHLKAIPTAEGVGALIRAGIGAQDPSEARMWENMRITGGKIEGEWDQHLGTTGEQIMGVWATNCQKLFVEHVEFFNLWGDGFYGDKNDVSYQSLGGQQYRPDNANVLHCEFHDIRRNAISLVGVASGTIFGNEFHDLIGGTGPQAGIDMEPDYEQAWVEDIIITANRFRKLDGPAIAIANTSPGVVDRILAMGNQAIKCGQRFGQAYKIVGPKGTVYSYVANQATYTKGDAMLVAGVTGQGARGVIIGMNHLSYSEHGVVEYLGGTERGAGLRLEDGIDGIASLANAITGNGCGDFSWDGVIWPDPQNQYIAFGMNAKFDNDPDVR